MKTFLPILRRSGLLSCTLCFVFFSTVSLSPAVVESDFADSLFREGDYLNAAHEYKRLLFLHPDAPQGDFIAFRVAASYQNAGQLKNAIRAYLTSLKQFLTEHKKSDLAPRVHFTIGMLHIDKGEWAEASSVWNNVSLTYSDSPFAEVSDRLARMVKNAETLPHRSPTVAGALSVLVPGSGQVYIGRTVDGLSAFASIAILGGASFYYADQERYEVAVPIGILGVFLYGNSIYQSIQTARAFNLQQERLFRSKLRQEIRDSGLFGAISPPTDEVKLVLWQSRF